MKPHSFTYNSLKGLVQAINPESGTITCSYDSSGNLSKRKDARPNAAPTNYAGAFDYFPNGALANVSLGINSLPQQYCQNSRLQIVAVRLGAAGGSTTTNCANSHDALNLAFSYGNSGYNNGNLMSETLLPLNATQSFSYDAYNRLSTAAEGSAWSQSYKYDTSGNSNVSFGNRYVSAYSGIVPLSFTPQSNANFNANNQLIIQGSSYDNSGNLKAIGGYSFTYDAESRQIGATVNGAGSTYSYDGEGRRVQKVSGGTTTVYVYDAKGEVTAEYSSAAPAEVGTQYLTGDHLGSTRLVSDASGVALGYHDYLPFGEEISSGIGGRGILYGAADGVTHKFTEKERDAETASSAMQGLDYFGARYFSGGMGRFTSPDPTLSSAHLENPRSWNRYAYVYNNPLRHIDPDGQQALDLSNPNIQKLLQTLRAPAGRALGTVKGGLIQTALEYTTRPLLGEIFGYAPMAIRGDLSAHEYALLNKVSAYEKGATMLGVGQQNQPGIDAVDVTNAKGITLKEASNIERAKDSAVDALKSADKAGFHDVEVFIDAPSVSKSDATGLSKIQNVLGTGTVTKVVVFTGQGAVEYRPTAEQQKQIACKQSGGSSCQ